ncbi:MAG: AAA family ATPase [Pseudomonadota bacterium]
MRVLAIANQKGGVGKTTTSVNLGAALAELGERVLLVDLDPQGNATMGCGCDKNNVELNIYDWLMADHRLEALAFEARSGFHVVPSNTDLTAAEVELMQQSNRERRLTERLSRDAQGYDTVLIDCPPSLNILTLNALVAAQGVLIPMQCEYYALEGLSALLTTIEGVRGSLNPQLAIDGVLRTMYDPRNSLTREVSRQLLDHFGDAVFRTVIPRNVRLAEAPSHGLPVLYYDRQSRGALAYMALAGELRKKRERSVAGATSTVTSG